MLDYIFVDIQGFKTVHNEFVVKEIFVLSKNLKFHEIIKSPIPYDCLSLETKKQADWLKRNYHGLAWNDGYITQSELDKIISPVLTGKIVFVKGAEKVDWIKDIFDTKMIVVNLEDFDCNVQLHTSLDSCVNDEDYDGNSQIFDDDSDYEVKRRTTICCKHKKLKKGSTQLAHCAVQNVWLMKDWFKKSSVFKKD